MKHTILASAAGLLATLAAATPSFAVTISTAVGQGADAQLASSSVNLATPTDTGSNGQQMNSRFNVAPTGTSNNDIIALRFDLTGYDLSTVTGVSLTLFSYRDDTSNRLVQLYGVTAFAAGKDNNGTTAGFNTTTWNEATVRFSTMPGLEWDTSVVDGDTDLDAANTTSLANATFTGTELGLGTMHSIGGTSLDTFVQSHSGTNLVTFLIRAGNTSTGQGRFGTKESTGLNGATGVVPAGTYAPFLTFTASPIPEPSSCAALAGLVGLGLVAARRRRA